MEIETQIKALGNFIRLMTLDWLKAPEDHFPPHESELSVENGVCVACIQEKAGISQSAASRYVAILHSAGYVIPTRIGKWTYYRRDEESITQCLRQWQANLSLTGGPSD